MNIAYDIFMLHPEAVAEVNKDPQLDTFFYELLTFVMERLKPLEERINKEEDALPDGHSGTVIQILNIEDGKFLIFLGYSKELVEKMKSCFSQKDFEFILQKIQAINDARNN
jgi:hypothetical protein